MSDSENCQDGSQRPWILPGTVALDELGRLHAEDERLAAYIARLEDRRSTLSEPVYERMRQDYDGRRAHIEAEAEKFRADARAEHVRLQVVLDDLQRAVDVARFDCEELEARLAIGELDLHDVQPQLTKRREALDSRLGEKESLDVIAARFAALLGPASAGATAKRPTPRPAPDNNAPPAKNRALEQTPVPRQSVPESGASAAPTSPPSAQPGSAPEPTHGLNKLAVVTNTAETSFETIVSGTDHSFIVPDAYLSYEVDGEHRTYKLGVVTHIGRAAGNELRFRSDEVSRRHARVTASMSGFTLVDLQSQNGCIVNGREETTHSLEDGDEIRLGDITLVFQLP